MLLFDIQDISKLCQVPFLVAIELDSPDRLTNLIEQLKYLRAIGAPIFLYENGKTQLIPNRVDLTGINYKYIECDYLHRPKMFNMMVSDTEADMFILHDVDVFLPTSQLIGAVVAVETGIDFCYPYISWKPIKSLENLDVPTVTDVSVGGSVVCRRSSFFAAGMENEHFRSWGVDDVERYARWQILGYKISRISGSLYHLEHWRDSTYNEYSTHWQQNAAEYGKIKVMTKDELLQYIKTWPWRINCRP